MKNLVNIQLNYNQTLIYGSTVVAIYDESVGIIIVQNEYRGFMDEVRAVIPVKINAQLTTVKFTSSFSVDTWDSKIRDQSVENRLKENSAKQ